MRETEPIKLTATGLFICCSKYGDLACESTLVNGARVVCVDMAAIFLCVEVGCRVGLLSACADILNMSH
jgi:hypothetical protein